MRRRPRGCLESNRLSAPTFIAYGAAHVAALVALGAAVAIAWRFLGGDAGAERADRLRRALAAFIVLHELGNVALHVFVVDFAWRESLPLNFCRANMWLVAWMLARRSYRAFEVAYFWAVVGAGVALLAPDLQEGFPHPLFFTFFVGHGLGIFAVVYALRGFGFAPRLASLARALLAAVALAAVAIPVNAWLDTNYLYLARRPEGSAILNVFEPWPGYRIGVFSMGLFACVLAWLPFARRAPVRESRETHRRS